MPIHQHPNPCHWDIIEGVWTAGCLEQSFKFLVRQFCVILGDLNAGITKLQQLNLLVIPCGVEEKAQKVHLEEWLGRPLCCVVTSDANMRTRQLQTLEQNRLWMLLLNFAKIHQSEVKEWGDRLLFRV